MTLPVKDKTFNQTVELIDKNGRPTQIFREYMAQVDRILTAMVAGNAPSNLVNAANDAAAAAAGVAIGQFYRNGSVVQMRVA